MFYITYWSPGPCLRLLGNTEKTSINCQCSFWLWVFLLFFPPSHTAFESRFCYANGFLPAAAELSKAGLERSQQTLQGKSVPFSQLLTKRGHTLLPSHTSSNWPCARVLLPGEVAAEPLGEVLEEYCYSLQAMQRPVYQSEGFSPIMKWDLCADDGLSLAV